MPKILITGASGMMGRYVRDRAEAAGYDIAAPARDDMDLMQPERVYDFVCDLAPEAILHLAAETNVDLCEREPRRAGIANHLATRAIALAARETGAWLLSMSAASVFGAQSKPAVWEALNELDIPCPTNTYNKAKLRGEREVETICPGSSLIVRAGWVIGGGPARDHKFVGKIVEQIAGGAQVLRGASDRYGAITSAPMLADFIVAALKQRRTGLLHYASSGIVSRFDVAAEIARIVSFKGPVEQVSFDSFSLPAPRPYFEAVRSIYINPDEPHAPGFWRDDLRDYLAEFGYGEESGKAGRGA